MPGRNPYSVVKVVLALSLLLLLANKALAYVGPGADLAFLSYAMTLLAWVLAASSAVLLWPIYALLRKIRGGKNKSTTAPPPTTTPAKVAAANPSEAPRCSAPADPVPTID